MTRARILILDPVETSREQLKAALNSEEFEIHVSSSVDGAVQVLAQQDSWAVLVVNSKLPGKDGFTFIREWKSKDPNTQAILVCDDAQKSDLLKALQLKVSDVLEKPIQNADIKRAVERCYQDYLSRGKLKLISSQPSEVFTPKITLPARPAPGSHLKLVSDGPGMEGSDQVLGAQRDVLGYTALKKQWVEEFEKEYISNLLKLNDGNVSAAAREAKLDRSNFLRLLRKHSLKAQVYRKIAA